MKTLVRNAPLLATLLAFASSPAHAGPSEDDLRDAGEKIVDFVAPGVGSKLFGDHPNIHPYQVDGKWVYAIPIRDEDGSRCTHNFDAKWEGARNFQVFVLGVAPERRAAMQFQRKGDKSWSSDSNRGAQFRHGESVVIDGGKNYLAERDFAAGDVLRDQPHACVLFLEDGLSFDSFRKTLD